MRPQPDLDLLQTYLDGELADELALALEVRLRAEPDLADALVRLAREDAILTEWARSAGVVQLAEGDTPRRIDREEPRRWSRRWAVVGGLAAAAAVVLAFLGHGHFRTEPPATELARLEEVQGEVFVVPEAGEPFPAQSGQQLASGQGLRTQGDGSSAVLAFDDKSRVELGADTTIRMPETQSGKRIILEQGTVAADVAAQPEGRPMIVATPHAEARFVKARSSVASTSAETRIESAQGKVQLTRKSDGRTLDLPVGWYAVAAGASNLFDAKPLPTQVVQPRTLLSEVAGQALSAALSPDGATLAIGCTDGSIKLWDVAAKSVRLTLPGGKRAARALAFAPVGHLLACTYDDRTLRFWDPVTGTDLGFLPDVRGQGTLAFSPSGTLLTASGQLGKSIELKMWDTATRQELSLPRDQVMSVGALAFAPDGQTLATAGGQDNAIKLWDVTLRQVRQTLPGPAGRITSLAFAADGRTLATAGAKDRSVKLWDLAAGKETRTLTAQGDVRALSFAPDGRLAVGADQAVTLWDAAVSREQVIFRGHKHPIGTVLFAEQGRTLVTVGLDRTVRLWDVPGS